MNGTLPRARVGCDVGGRRRRCACRLGRGSMALLPVAAVLGAALLAGCGSSGEEASNASQGQSAGIVQPGAHTSTPAAEAVATINGTPITKSSYEHWLAVERASGSGGESSHRALAFLITSSWVLGEAHARNVSVSEAQVKARLASLEKQSFPKKGQLHKFLSKYHETEADLLVRVRVEMLRERIAKQATSKASSGKTKTALAALQSHFEARWKQVTSCKPGYVMEDCRQYKGSGEPGLSASTSQKSSGSASTRPGESGKTSGSSGSTAGSSSSSASGAGVYKRPGSFSIGSPAFEGNGSIPSTYTCDGKGISPPLSWSNVPKHASELVLFVIDDTESGASGGIRWVMGGIDPSSHGVSAGSLPSGAIVGSNAEGKASYGPICPAKGKTDTIELVMYALKKPIKLSPGFQPSTAEQEYGSTKDLLGEAAVSYATYRRP